jgi:hypothetical protein
MAADYLIGHGSEVAQCQRWHRGHGLIPIFVSGSLPQSRQPNESASNGAQSRHALEIEAISETQATDAVAKTK